MQGSKVDLVLLTGGHSQWYFVAEQLTGRLSQCGEIELDKIQKDPGRIIPVPRPQETVALGLVYNPLVEQISFTASTEQMAASQPTPALPLKPAQTFTSSYVPKATI